MHRPKIILIGLAVGLGIAAAVCLGIGVAQSARSGPARRIAKAREWAGLASLPSSATQVSVSETDAPTWTAYYLRFQAPARDIDAFLAASPGLRGVRPEVFTPKHQLLPATGPGHVPTTQQLTDGNAYITLGTPGPAWFDRTVRRAGRRYTIMHGGNYGEVVVNDDTHTVSVYVADS